MTSLLHNLTGNGQGVMAVAAPDVAAAPEGIADGLWLIATRWLAPLALSLVEAEVSIQVVSGGKATTREYRFTGADVASVFAQLLTILNGTAAAYGVPLQAAAKMSSTSKDALIALLMAS